jgi:class 3 adenylate cyclase/CheY-like chemotaxis protein
MAGDRDPVQHDRAARALAAYLRQEIEAPVVAIAGFLEIVEEDAKRYRLVQYLADLERMARAAAELRELVRIVVERRWSGWRLDENVEGATHRLQHDLRTPLNAIKGYAELLIEEGQEKGSEALLHDLRKIVESAARLLGQVDGMLTAIGAEPDAPMPGAAARASPEAVLTALRTIPPLPPGNTETPAPFSSRILVVDDNDSSRDLLSRRLTHAGHQVRTASEGAAALGLAASDPPDLILLDIMMPGMSGFEVLCRLKADQGTASIPVIMISALDEVDSVVRCIEAGAEDFLPKDFNPVLLRARVAAALEKKRMRDRESLILEELRAEKERSEGLLLNILPGNVVARLRGGEKLIADRFHAVTILFCDLVDFTPLAARLQPQETVRLLGEVFAALDELAAARQLERMKTIGDAYMVASGLPGPRADHAIALADLALSISDVIATIGRSAGHVLEARIGMHTGPVIAGVIGARKLAYDVWGDTVNTASRMESFGVPGRIHVSAATRHALGDEFLFEPRGPIAIKGKGLMETYFLLGRAPSPPSPLPAGESEGPGAAGPEA